MQNEEAHQQWPVCSTAPPFERTPEPLSLWGTWKTASTHNWSRQQNHRKKHNNQKNTKTLWHYASMLHSFPSLLSWIKVPRSMLAARLVSSLGAHGGKVEHAIRRAAIGRFVEVGESQFQIASLQSPSNFSTVPLVPLGWARGFDETIEWESYPKYQRKPRVTVSFPSNNNSRKSHKPTFGSFTIIISRMR